jgi:superfamily II DNA or RNA helicase
VSNDIYTEILRDYQRAGIDGLRDGFKAGHTRQILVSPTGSGKTEMACAIAQLAQAQGNRMWFIVDRKVLSSQTKARFESYGLKCSVWQGENTQILPDSDVVVATVQTLRSRLKDYSGNADFRLFDGDLIAIDEVHQFHQFHRDLLTARDDLPCIGLSATPHNGSLGLFFTNVVSPVNILDLIRDNYLVRFRVYQPAPEIDLEGVRFQRGDFVEADLAEKMTAITGDVVTHWMRHGEGRPTIAFCVNVSHAREMAQEFERCGIQTGVVVGGTPDEERAELYEKLRTGRIRILTSVYVLGVGFDLPEASCAILARPTASEALHIQQCGRVARPAEGKTDALILDHAGNTLAHGLPQNYVPPGLDAVDSRTTRTRDPIERTAIRCADCGYVMEPGQIVCPACGVEREYKADVLIKDGRLVEVDTITEPADPKQDPDYRRQIFSEWLSYYESLPKIKNARGCTAYCYEHYFGQLPWADSAIGKQYKAIPPEPFTVEAKQMAVRYFKHKQAVKRGRAKKETKGAISALPEWSGKRAGILNVSDCDHAYTKMYQGKGQHVAQLRCEECNTHLKWVSALELQKASQAARK